MKILVTGGAGYIGSVLIPQILEKGYQVKCLDKFFFGRGSLKDVESKIEIIKDDTRCFNSSILKDVSVVVDLAAISQPDPAGQIDSAKFYDMNYLGPFRVANLSKQLGVERYVFPSTCSTYGSQSEFLDEKSPLNPLEIYAKTKVLAESAVLSLSDEEFSVTGLRLGTVYGLSPKMRFDLVLNGMTLSLFKMGKIMVMRDGRQVRPIVHVKDVARAIMKVIEADEEKTNGEVFNVGANNQNFEIFELAKLIGDSIGISYETEWYGGPDTRSYRVNFDKIGDVLGFKTDHTPKEGVAEIYEGLKDGVVKDSEEAHVIRWYKRLQDNFSI